MDSFAPNMESIFNSYHPGFLAMIEDNRAVDFEKIQRMILRYNQKRGIPQEANLRFASLYLLISRWRRHRAIYHFDPILWQCLVDQAADVRDTEILPSEFILHLPYECIQIEGLPIEIVLDALGQKPAKHNGVALITIMQPGTVDPDFPCLFMIWENINRRGSDDFYLPIIPGGTILDCYDRLRSIVDDETIHQQSSVAMTRIAIQFILYLMAINADVEESDPNEENADSSSAEDSTDAPVKKRRHKSNHQRGKKNLLYHVGYHVGPSLGAAESSENHSSGITIRPHIRRGHWQHYWRGPRDGERERILKWKSPIVVKGDMGDDLPTVISVK